MKFLSLFILFSRLAYGECTAMEALDLGRAECVPVPVAGMPMKMAMVHANLFGVHDWAGGLRGRDAWSGPGMVMADLGSSLGDAHYLNFSIMTTAERWTLPDAGYPELLQIGEERRDHTPYLDAQHPHSSPLMGVELSDTLSLARERDYAKFYFAPRGSSTDGPVAFMHRPTGMVNPDAPLGHHVGQDVGHISSTVLGATLRLRSYSFEASTFHGQEPEPQVVDLPMARPDSFAFRLGREFNEHVYALASVAFVEPGHVTRLSGSFYYAGEIAKGWQFNNTLVWGRITHYDEASSLSSVLEEFSLVHRAHTMFGRFEILQRTPSKLEIDNQDHAARWVSALTLGYTYTFAARDDYELGLGGSLTQEILPAAFRVAYGNDPRTARVFLHLSGMRMWNL